jgi:hypothetical protein
MNKACWSTLLGVLFLTVAHIACAQTRIPPKYSASPMEVAQLPKYCWAQYVDGAYFGHPIYSIPAVCGAYTNHFCPALVYLNQGSKISRSKAQRQEDLRHAAQEIAYTLQYIKPNCPIYPDVEAARIRTETLRKFSK